MSGTLQLSRSLAMPVDLATHVTLVAGKRGSGKTNTAKRIVEQVIRAGVPVAILDPADVWWGLRAGRGGTEQGGLPVHVFGGRHQDLPLESTAGALLADVVVEQRVSVVMAIREFSGAERARFIKDFAERLIRTNVNPLLVVAEEAHEVMPQEKTSGSDAVALGAMLRLVTLGRSSGIGLLQVTQRLARLNKTATTQSDVLFAHRTIGPQDRDALEEWIKYHHAGAHRAAFMERLPALKTGEAWLWAPDFPEDAPIGLEAVAIAACETFNSHATPKVGELRQEPKALAAVDLERLRARLAATIEKAKAEDPRELRRQIGTLMQEQARLTAALSAAQQATAMPATVAKETRILTEKDREVLATLADRIQALSTVLNQEAAAVVEQVRVAVASAINTATADMHRLLERGADEGTGRLGRVSFTRVLEKLSQITPTTTTAPRSPLAGRVTPQTPVTSPRPARQVSAGPKDPAMKKGGKFTALMVALAQAGRPLSDRQLSARAVMALSGTFDTYLGQMRQAGWVDGTRQALAITPAGLTALGAFDPLPEGAELRAHWLAQVSGGKERALLQALFDAYPAPLAAAELATAAGMALSGTFDTYLGHLRRLQLVDGTRAALRANPELFADGDAR